MAEGLGQESNKLYGFLDKNRELSPSQIDYEVGAFAPILLSEGLNTVLIRFTPEQYKWLLSSAITGAYIIYPENPLNAVFPLLECVDMPINNCAEVANCIESNPATREALSEWFRDSQYNESLQRALEGLSSGGTGYNGSTTCDDDALFGSITAVFDELNQSAIDWLEILDASSQLIELLSEWGEELVALSIASGGTWVIATSIIAVIANVIEQFILDLYQNYQASYSTELRDELRCEFFCYAQANDCTYTALDILTWIEPQVAFTAEDLLGLVSWFFGLTIDISRVTVLRMWYFELKLYQFAITNTLASLFVGQPARDAMVRLTKVSQASDPDPDWSIICDECVTTWTHTFDFTANNGGWIVDSAGFGGTYVAGQYWQHVDIVVSGGRRRVVRIKRDFASTVITGFTVNHNWTKGNNTSSLANGLRFYVGGLLVTPNYIRNFGQLASTETSYTVDGLNITTTQVALDHTSCVVAVGVAWSGIARVVSVTLRGEGINPFI